MDEQMSLEEIRESLGSFKFGVPIDIFCAKQGGPITATIVGKDRSTGTLDRVFLAAGKLEILPCPGNSPSWFLKIPEQMPLKVLSVKAEQES